MFCFFLHIVAMKELNCLVHSSNVVLTLVFKVSWKSCRPDILVTLLRVSARVLALVVKTSAIDELFSKYVRMKNW